MDSTGRRMCRLRAGDDGLAPLSTPSKASCCTSKNGGLTRHVLALTPMGGTDVKTSGRMVKLGCLRNRLCINNSIGATPNKVCHGAGLHANVSNARVDAYAETSRDGGSIPPASTMDDTKRG